MSGMSQFRPEFRVYYFTPKYDETVAFYRDGLGLSVYRSWDRDEGDRGTIFVAPNGRGLIEIEYGAQVPVGGVGLYIEASDLESWYERVQKAGATVTKAIGETDYGHRNFKIVDPSGIELSFFRYVVEPK